MRGIVKCPVITIFAAPLPTIEPTRPLETTEAFAAPPLKRPTKAKERFTKTSPTRVASKRAPKIMKIKTT